MISANPILPCRLLVVFGLMWFCCLPAESQAQTVSLDLGARVQPHRASNSFSVPGYHVWCGAPVKGTDGKFHLFYSRWPEQFGFHPGWALHSEIAYASADDAAGPYHHVNVALKPRGINPATGNKFWDADVTHNPNVVMLNGVYYLFYTGQSGDGISYSKHRNSQRIGLATATDPGGPWKRMDAPVIDVSVDRSAFDSLCVTNPAACVHPDGSVLIIYKAVQYVEGKEMGGNVRYGAAIASHPSGPYQKTPGRIFERAESGKTWMLEEDPYVWFSAKYGNRYYAIARDVVGTFSGAAGGICMFESTDGLDWREATHGKVLGNRFLRDDGTLSEKQLERPALLFENDEPIFLFGATDGYEKHKTSRNVQIELRP